METIDGLEELIHESVRDVVVADANGMVPVSRIVGRGLYDESVSLIEIEGGTGHQHQQ